MLSMTAQILTKVHTIFSNPRICGWSQKERIDITLRKEGVRKRKSLLNSPTTHQGKYFLWPEDALFLCNSLYFCCSIPGGYLRKISRSGEPQLIFNVQIYRKNALVYFTRQCWFSMIQCILCHIAILDGAKGGEDGADVLLSEVSVDACQIQPVETGESMRLLPRKAAYLLYSFASFMISSMQACA